MGRPQLPMGHHGKITITTEHLDPETGAWVVGKPTSKRTPVRYTARCRVRDLDGVTRAVKATADTAGEAQRRAQEKVRDRATPGGGDLTRATRMADLAAAWLVGMGEGKVEGTTADVYRRAVRAYLLPALGDLRVWEVTVPVGRPGARSGPAGARLRQREDQQDVPAPDARPGRAARGDAVQPCPRRLPPAPRGTSAPGPRPHPG